MRRLVEREGDAGAVAGGAQRPALEERAVAGTVVAAGVTVTVALRPRGTAEAEHIRIRAAADLDAVDRERIDGVAAHRLEISHRDIRRRD